MPPIPNLVSIIIPSYNSSAYITQALDSCINQTYKNIEIIVVDDGSTDNTESVLQPYFPHITYLKQPNAGPSAARNNGIRHAHGDLIAFLDADDLWFPEKLEKQVTFMRENPQYGMIYCDMINFQENTGEIVGKSLMESGKVKIGHIFWDLMGNTLFTPPTVLIHKHVLDTVGLFDESLRMAEDANLWLRIAYKFEIGFVPHVLFKRRIHENNISRGTTKNHLGIIHNIQKIVELHPEITAGREQFFCDLFAQKYFELSIDELYCGSVRDSFKMIALSTEHKLSLRNILIFLKSLVARNIRMIL